jgi:putative transposase
MRHGVWLYFGCCLSYRDVEALRAERGVRLTYDAVRSWGRNCGHTAAPQLRRRRPSPGATWHVDEVVLSSHGARHCLGRAVDQDGQVLEMLGPRGREKQAAQTCCRKLWQGVADVPRVRMTDTLKSSGAATRESLPEVEHRPPGSRNNRAAPSHRPTRQRERGLPGCKSPGHAPRVLAAYGPLAQHVRPRRQRLSAPDDRREMAQRFQSRREVTGIAIAASRICEVQPAEFSVQ